MTPFRDTSPASKNISLLLAGLIVLLATLLRVHELERSPLWCDEGNNAYLAHQSLSGLIEASRMTHDTDPPAHRLALKLWLAALGDSAFNLRLLSVTASVGIVIVVLAWGWRWCGPRAGALAGLLTALSPMMIYYGREAKGYAFVTFFGALALYLWACRLRAGNRSRAILGWWAIYVLAEVLALGAHYYAILLIAAQAIWLALDALIHRPGWATWTRQTRPWVIAQLTVGAAIAPWLWLTWADALHGARHVPLDRQAWSLLEYIRQVAAQFAAGPHAPAWADILAVGALLSAAIWAVWRGPRQRAALLAVLVIAPVALGYVAQRWIAFFWPRFLLYATPPLYLLAAWGLARLRKAGLVVGAALAIAWAAALPTAYTPFVGPEEDLRPFAQSLRVTAREGDGVVVGYIWQEGILRMLASDLPVTYYLGWFPEETVDAQMRALVADHPRLWLLTYRAPLQHPVNPGGWWLEQRAARVLMTENGPTRLALYLSPCNPTFSSNPTAEFASGIQLRHAPLDATIGPGQPLPVSLQWTISERQRARYTVFVHLYDKASKLIAQTDSEPVNGLQPFSHIEPGQPVTDCRALFIPADAAPGRYLVAVGLYAPDTGQRLLVASGAKMGQAHTILGEVTIQ